MPKPKKTNAQPSINYTSLCTEENWKYGTWYSDTYRASISVNGSPNIDCDMTHIRIPLAEEKEAIAAEMFSLKKEDMPAFNEWLWQRLRRHVQNVRLLNKANVNGVIELYQADVQKDVNGSEIRDIYLLTPRYMPYHDAIKDKDLPLTNVIGLGIRMGNILRDIAAADIAHGDICMDAIYSDEEGKLFLGNFLYSDSISAPKDENPYQYVLPAHASERSIVTGRRTQNEDVYALCSLIWNIVGEIPADERMPYRVIPKKAPPELINTLRTCMSMDQEAAIPGFRKYISDMMRTQKVDNSAISFFVPGFRPVYTTEEVPVREATEEDLFIAIEDLHRRAAN